MSAARSALAVAAILGEASIGGTVTISGDGPG